MIDPAPGGGAGSRLGRAVRAVTLDISVLQDKSKLLAIMKDGEFAKMPEIRSQRSRFVA